MKTGDIIEYQNRHDHSWEKGRMVGELADGNFVIECQPLGVFTRYKHEVRRPKVKVTRWVNLYREGNDSVTGGRLHKTEEDAIAYVKSTMPSLYIKTVPVTWEE